MRSIFVTILVLAIIGLGLYFLLDSSDSSGEFFTSRELSSKIVYELVDGRVSDLRSDCAGRLGKFNTCGSMCEADEICATVCVYTCELETRTNADKTRTDPPSSKTTDRHGADKENIKNIQDFEFFEDDEGEQVKKLESEVKRVDELEKVVGNENFRSSQQVENSNIKVNSPSADQTVSSPITVSGEAKTDQVIVRIQNKAQTTLIEETVNAHNGKFSVKISYSFSATKEGFIEIQAGDNELSIPVKYN